MKGDTTEPVLVSACLLGHRCRYNGEVLNPRPLNLPAKRIVPVCPEQLGGLAVPRSPSFFDRDEGGEGVLNGTTRVISEDGTDRTAAFLEGAERTLAIARETGAASACLKERSPSCGCREIYVGPVRKRGCGVTTALLKRNGIRIIPVD